MHQFKVLAVVGILALTGQAVAAPCSGTRVTGGSATIAAGIVNTIMSGKRVYAAGSGDDWKEDHCAAGALYKVGDPQNPVDPRVNEGTWSATEEYIEEDGVFRGGITYNYTGSTTTYPFYLNVDNTTTPTTVYFCNPVTDEQIAASTYLSAMPGGLDCN